jgi:6-phosphogluconolactonase
MYLCKNLPTNNKKRGIMLTRRPGRFLPALTRMLLGGLLLASLSALGSCGGSGVSSTPPPAKTYFAYVADSQTGQISGYSVDSGSGALTPLPGFPLLSGLNPTYITHDSQNKFVIVADIAANTLHVYAVDASTGALSETDPSPYQVDREPRALGWDPAGNFLYVAYQGENEVGAFSFSSAGTLTPVPGAPFPTGGASLYGCSVVVAPSGKFLYVEDLFDIYAFEINPATGALALVGSVQGPSSGGGLAVDPAGAFVYAVGSGANSEMTYAIDPVSGVLSPTSTSPLTFQDGAYTITLDASGSFAYTVESGVSLAAYSLKNGVLTNIGSVSGGAYGSLQLTIDPTGSFIYAGETGTVNEVVGYRVASSGTLTALPSPPVSSGGWPVSITVVSE